MRNESIYHKTAEDVLMLLLVTCVLGVASLVMTDWPGSDIAIQSKIPDQVKPENVLDALNSMFIKPFSVLVEEVSPRLHLATLSLFNI